jgi:hypothetical protein
MKQPASAPAFLKYGVLGILIAGAAVTPLLHRRQTEYLGRPLTEWLIDLTAESDPHPPSLSLEMRANRHREAIVVIREMGTNILPMLLHFLTASPEPDPFRHKLRQILASQSFVGWQIPQPPDRQRQAIEAFRALGPIAAPAIPKLAELLDSGTNYSSPVCLEAIGPESVPALLHALTNSNQTVVRVATEVLGEFGTSSQAAVPYLVGLAAGSNACLAYTAIQVLSEIDLDPSRHVALFESALLNSNLVNAAAFALGRVGPDGILPLLQALAGSDVKTRTAAVAALAPEVRNARQQQFPDNYSFRGAICLFNHRSLSCAWHLFDRRDESGLVVPVLMSLCDHPDPRVRIRVLELCAGYKVGVLPP